MTKLIKKITAPVLSLIFLLNMSRVNTKELSSKTMMSNKHKNLFFIGEVVDVTGHLGGYNFQWAWSSGYVAGQYA